jgi:hypothetical protein
MWEAKNLQVPILLDLNTKFIYLRSDPFWITIFVKQYKKSSEVWLRAFFESRSKTHKFIIIWVTT